MLEATAKRTPWRRKTHDAPLPTGSVLHWLTKDFTCGICGERHKDSPMSLGEKQPGFCAKCRPWATVALQPAHYQGGSPERDALYANITRIRQTLERGAGAVEVGPAMPFWAFVTLFAERYPDADPLTPGASSTSEVKHLLLFFADTPLHEIGPESAEAFTADFLRGVSRRGPRKPASARPPLELLRRMMSFAFARGLVEENPFPRGTPLGPPSPGYASDRLLTVDEEDSLHAACVDDFAYLRAILIFVADAPAHLRDFLRLRWADVDEAAGIINIDPGNTRRCAARRVQMTPRLRAALASLRGRSKPSAGSPLVSYSVDRCNYDFEKVRAAAGVGGLNWSVVRRAGAWRLEQAGRDARQIAAALGMTHLDNVAELLRVNAEAAAREAVSPRLRQFLEVQLGVQAQAQNGNGQKNGDGVKKSVGRPRSDVRQTLVDIREEVLKLKAGGRKRSSVTSNEIASTLGIGGVTGGNAMMERLRKGGVSITWAELKDMIWDEGRVPETPLNSEE